MKKLIFSILVTMAGISSNAQPGIVKSRPANTGSEKALTMEETILRKETRLKNQSYFWHTTSDSLIFSYIHYTLLHISSVRAPLEGTSLSVVSFI